MYNERGFQWAWRAPVLLITVLPGLAQAQFGGEGPRVVYAAIAETDGVHPGQETRAVITFKLSEGWHINSHQPLDEFLIPTVLSFPDNPAYTVDQIIYPKHKLLKLSFSPDPLAVYEHEFRIGIVLKLAADLEPNTYTVNGTLTYQACNDKACFPPKDLEVAVPITVVAADQPISPQEAALFTQIDWTPVSEKPPEEKPAEPAPEVEVSANSWADLADGFVVAGRLDGYADTRGFLLFLDNAEAGITPEKGLAGKSWWLVLALVLGGGLLLNLTPCVLPLIPINIAIIGAGAQAGSRSRGFLLGGAYGAGIALVYGLLGLVVVLGVSSAFGAINATPWFNGVIALLFLVLGLAMFEIINIDFSRYQAKIGLRKNENGRFLIAFVMGAVSALLAGACVAPVVIYTIVYAQDQFAKGVVVALLLPFLLGVGMALPWPFAGAGLSFLPRPGAWMVRIKQAFGVLIIAFALYYGHLAYTLFSDRYLVDRAAVEASVQAADAAGWYSSLSEGLRAAQIERKPVLIDFWATWCKNCLVMNQTTLKAPEVLQRLEGYVKIKYQAENPADAATSAVLERYDVLGLPTYVVLERRTIASK